MKVVVVGMLDRQVKMAGEEAYEYLDIHYTDKNARTGVRDAAHLKNADRLLVMTKFVAHSMLARIDRSKVTYVNGGVSALRDALRLLNDAARIQAQETKQLTTPFEDEEDMARPSQYEFQKLPLAKTGDVVVFRRPEGVTVENFRSRMMAAKNYYRNTHGVVAEIEFAGGNSRCEFLITKSAEEANAEEKTPEVVAIEGPVPPAVEEPKEPVPEAVSAFRSHVDPHVQWWRVFLASLEARPSAPDEAHVTLANKAVDAWSAKFKETR